MWLHISTMWSKTQYHLAILIMDRLVPSGQVTILEQVWFKNIKFFNVSKTTLSEISRSINRKRPSKKADTSTIARG